MGVNIKVAEEKQETVKPFLKWAGGKQQIVKHLLARLPGNVKERTYREPFLGGGSLFFALQPKKAVISDANEHLIHCYKWVRERPNLIAEYLRDHEQKNSEEYYYKVREFYNKATNSAAQAARFIYLNKACFNGIFRVNMNGIYNVPYGKRKHPAFPSIDHLGNVSKALESATLLVKSFEDALRGVNKNDFVYLDPPYPPLNSTSYFTHYTSDKFNNKDQEKLASVVKDLDRTGCLFMISNADTERIQQLYKRFRIMPLSVTRFITCKSTRHKVDELVITNYEVTL